MQRVKAFFYVCAGLFLLALTYHLGAQSATAQTGVIEAPNIELDAGLMYVIGRTFYVSNHPDGGPPSSNPNPIPGSSAVIETGLDNNSPAGTQYVVLLENGDVYATPWDQGTGRGPWSPVGNVFGGPVNVEQHTLGQLKARFRDPAPTSR